MQSYNFQLVQNIFKKQKNEKIKKIKKLKNKNKTNKQTNKQKQKRSQEINFTDNQNFAFRPN